jgi:hypothetical protein
VRERIETAPGWIGFALQLADITTEADAMRARGADVRGPKPGRLVAPDGTVRSWQTVTVGSDDLFSAAEPLPFLIQHDSSGAQHQQELAGSDSISPHPNGAKRLQAIILAVADLSNAAQSFGQAYGLSPFSAPFQFPEIGATAVVLGLDEVDEQLVLARPKETGIVADRMTNAGEGVCCIVVAVEDIAAARTYLESAGTTFERWPGDLLFIPTATTGGAALIFAFVGDDNL